MSRGTAARRRRTRAVGVLGAALLPVGLLAGCSGDDGQDGAEPSASSSAASSEESASDGTTTPDATTTPASDEERLRTVVETQLDFENLPAEAFGAVPEGLPEGVLPADQDPNFVVGMGDPEGGWVVFVQSTAPAPDSLAAAAQRLTGAGYVAGAPVPVGDAGELAAPAEADPGAFGDLQTFARDGVLVGVGARVVDAEAQVALPSVVIYVVAPA